MPVLSSAIDDLFSDPNLARDALWREEGRGAGIPIRVIARRGDRIRGFGETRVISETALFEVRVSEIAAPAAGDTIEIPGASPGTDDAYVVQGAPIRDPERLVWTVEAYLKP